MRIVIDLEGNRDDTKNKATSAYQGGVTHRYAVAKGKIKASGADVVRIYLPTLRDVVDLIRACPHLRLTADRHVGLLR